VTIVTKEMIGHISITMTSWIREIIHPRLARKQRMRDAMNAVSSPGGRHPDWNCSGRPTFITPAS